MVSWLEDRKDLVRWRREKRESNLVREKAKIKVRRWMDKRQGLNLQDLEAGRKYRKRQVADLWRMSMVAIH